LRPSLFLFNLQAGSISLKKFLYSVFILCNFFLKGQTQLYTIDDGLSSKDISSILQSRTGFIWVGTTNGLNVYDGYTFREYNRESGLSNGKIKCLYEDKKGMLWIGTWRGLNILNPKTGEIKVYFNTDKNSADSTTSSEVNAIHQHTDGSIVVGLGNGELLRFQDENRYKKVFQLPNREKVFKYKIYSFKSSPDSCLFMLTNFGSIRKLDKHFKELKTFKVNSEDIVQMEFTQDQNELVLVDAFSAIFYVSSRTGDKIINRPILTMPQKPDHVIAAYLSDKRKMWQGFGDGSLIVTDLQTKKHTDYSLQMNRFTTGAPSCMYEDNKGILWIGTHYGLIKFYPKKNLFENYLTISGGEYKDKNSIRGLMENDSGDIYVGGYNGLFKIFKKDTAVKHYRFKNHPFGKTNAYYPYRLLEDEQYIWMSSEIKGLYRLNKQTSDIEFPISTSEFFRSCALLASDSNNLWVGTHNGLFLYNKSNNQLAKHQSQESGIDISNIEVTDLVRDSDNNIWIGSYSSGLFKMNEHQKIIQEYSQATTNFPIDFISTLFLENDTILWAGTRGAGIFKINTLTNTLKVYTKKNGLADNSVAGILKDNSGIFWISTFNGLSRFDSEKEKFKNYYDKDGLTDNEFNISSHLKTKDGKLYFGGLNGLNAFYSDSFKKEAEESPKIFLTRFLKYDGRKDSIYEQYHNLSELKEISLSHKDKFFSFYFSLDDFYDPLRNTFYYKLEGYDKDWTNIGTQNNIRFNTIPAGTYTLRLKGVNSEGIASANELTISLSISQPFYSTWWFYLFLILIISTAAYSVARYRIYQVLKIRNLRTKISSDLHDEVGSLLTRITIQAELMKQGISKNDTVQEVTKIADTSRLATAAMSDVLWSIDARNDQIGSLIDRLREQAGEILFPLEMEVDFEVKNIDLDKQLPSILRQNLFLIFKEAIHNVILLENRTSHFVMSVHDNGKTKTATTKQGQGLRNMKMRAELMGGILEISMEKGYHVILKTKKL
jgi:ligand-binding sensor domain-containing protein